jgi:hypothetical protein
MRNKLIVIALLGFAIAVGIYAGMQPQKAPTPERTRPEVAQPADAGASAKRQASDLSGRATFRPSPSTRAKLKTDGAMSLKDLDRDFKDFMGQPDLPIEQLAKEAEVPVKHADRRSRDVVIAEETRDILAETYPVQEVQQHKNGEVWIKIDKEEVSTEEMEQMMADAANLQSYAAGPDHSVKVVVWAGGRPRAVRTFFGPQMF